MSFSFSKQFFARRLLSFSCPYESVLYPIKKQCLSSLTGTVVELGPGSGVNLPYYPKRIRWIGIEPNPFLHATLQNKLKETRLNGEVLLGSGEQLPIKSESVDTVVATFVLCSVGSPSEVLREIRRILKPKGKFFFIDHVAGRGVTKVAQTIASPLCQCIADGCHPNRDIEKIITTFPWKSQTLHHFVVNQRIIGPHLWGIMVR